MEHISSRSFRKSWKHYVRGNIVTEHARRLIINFLSACCTTSRTESDDEQEEQIAPEEPHDLPGMQLSSSAVHRLIQQARETHVKGMDDDATRRSAKVGNALALGTVLWGGALEDGNTEG